MKSSKDKYYPKFYHDDWIKQADRDFEIAKIAFTKRYYEWAIYASQQACEKSLKSILHLLNQKHEILLQTHSIQDLIDLLPTEFSKFNKYLKSNKTPNKLCATIDQHITRCRYPVPFKKNSSPGAIYKKKDAEEVMNISRDIIEICKAHISKIEILFNNI
ncbi:HEPN domain-containing protein [candidate division TA06 bacterium]|uniref:HEPN domain-containing protein n=1 Tax=candidate division TA06 bacterium TaxID=2250710 RepID=A0A933ICQ2_UNCT6|nr:HEPN domain-containing protein [candidate division TA06 bacterium]